MTDTFEREKYGKHLENIIQAVFSDAEEFEKRKRERFYRDPVLNPELKALPEAEYMENISRAREIAKTLEVRNMLINFRGAAKVINISFDRNAHRSFTESYANECIAIRSKELAAAGADGAEILKDLEKILALPDDKHGPDDAICAAAKAATKYRMLLKEGYQSPLFKISAEDIIKAALLHDLGWELQQFSRKAEHFGNFYTLNHPQIAYEIFNGSLKKFLIDDGILGETAADFAGEVILLHSLPQSEIKKLASPEFSDAIILIGEAAFLNKIGLHGIETAFSHEIRKKDEEYAGENRISKWPLMLASAMSMRKEKIMSFRKSAAFFREEANKIDAQKSGERPEDRYAANYITIASQNPLNIFGELAVLYGMKPADVLRKGFLKPADLSGYYRL